VEGLKREDDWGRGCSFVNVFPPPPPAENTGSITDLEKQ